MRFVGYVFHKVSHFLSHLLRQIDAVALLQDIVDASFSGLAVDPDHIGIVFPSHILRVDRKIWNRPGIAVLLFSPVHTLGNRILM